MQNQHSRAGKKATQTANYAPRALYTPRPTSTGANPTSSPLTLESDAPKLARAMRLLGIAIAPDATAPRSTRSSSACTHIEYNDNTSNDEDNEVNTIGIHFVHSSALSSDPGKPRTFAAALKSSD